MGNSSEKQRIAAEMELACDLAQRIRTGTETIIAVRKGPLPEGARRLLFDSRGIYIGSGLSTRA